MSKRVLRITGLVVTVLVLVGAGLVLRNGAVQAAGANAPAAQGSTDDKGIVITRVTPNGAAAKAGVVRGDILTEVDGTAVNTCADLNTALQSYKAGDTVKLTVQHGDAAKSLSATLADVNGRVDLGIGQCGAGRFGGQGGFPFDDQNGQGGQGGFGFPFGDQNGQGGFGFPFGDQNGQGSQGNQGGGFQLPGASGEATITEVVTGSPAEKAGLKQGDVITAVDGQALSADHTLSDAIAAHKPGDTVTLTIKNGDTTTDIKVTLGENPNKAGTAYLGLRYQSLPNLGNLPGLRPPFGQGGQDSQNGQGGQTPNTRPARPNNGQNGQGGQGGQGQTPNAKPALPNNGQSGVVLRSIAAGSPAETAGLQQGDVVTKIDGQAVSNPQALIDAVTAHKPGDKVTLTVTNNGAAREVTVTLGENPNKAGTPYLGAELGSFFRFERGTDPNTTPGTTPNTTPSRPNRQPNSNGRTTA